MTGTGLVVFGVLCVVALLDGWGGDWGQALFWLGTGGGFAGLDWAEVHSRPARPQARHRAA